MRLYKKIVFGLVFLCLLLPTFAQEQKQQNNDSSYNYLMLNITDIKKNLNDVKTDISSMKAELLNQNETSFQTLDSELKKTIDEKTSLSRLLIPIILFQLAFFFFILFIIGAIQTANFLEKLRNKENIKCICGNYAKYSKEKNVFECEVCKSKYQKVV